MLLKETLQDQIKSEFKNNGFEILKEKKYIFQKMRLKNFIKFMSLNHFIMIYVLIYHLDLLL